MGVLKVFIKQNVFSNLENKKKLCRSFPMRKILNKQLAVRGVMAFFSIFNNKKHFTGKKLIRFISLSLHQTLLETKLEDIFIYL